MLWLCISLSLLPMEIFTRGRSGTDRAVVVADNGRINCGNTLAEASGIYSGMSVATASTLHHSLAVLERQPEREQQALTTLAHWCYQFTPAVSVAPPENILLDLHGSLKLFAGLPSLWQQLTDGLLEQGFSYRLGLAHTPYAASTIAATGMHRHGLPDYFDLQTQTLDINRLNHYLQQLPLSFLDCTDKEQNSLRQMGFTVLGDVMRLPAPAIGKRLGKNFLHKLQQLMGARSDPRLSIQPPTVFYSELYFLNGIGNANELLFPMQRLLGELCHFMQIRQVCCQEIHWQLSVSHRISRLTLKVSRHTSSKEQLLELTRLQLEKIRLTGGVENLALQAGDFLPATPQNAALFPGVQEQQAEYRQAGALLLDKLKIRLGQQQIHGVELQDSHTPEQAWQAIPWERLSFPDTVTSPRATPTMTNSEWKRQRPCWLLPRPMPIQQKDKALLWNGRLQLLQGPERIDSRWWDKPVQRDYFIARHDSGAIYWVFRELPGQRWFVYGLFG